MTKKIIRWYKKMTFWNFVLKVIAPIATGGELAVYFAEGHPSFYWIIGIAAGITIYIKAFFKDDNKNGIVDLFE